MQRPGRRSPLAWIRVHKIIFILILFVLGVVGLFAYQKIALYQNKRAFEQARKSIDLVYADIVRQVGQPDNYKMSNSCSRSYQEFTGYGDINCDIDTSFAYGVGDQNESNRIFKQIQAIIGSQKKLVLTSKTPSDSISDTFVVNAYYHEAQDFYKFGELKCTSKYVYDTPEDTYLELKKGSQKKSLFVIIGCSGNARHEYYP